MSLFRHLRILVLLVASPVIAAGDDTVLHRVEIPTGDAAETLRIFGRQVQREIMFLADSMAGVKTHPVHGVFTAREALERMIAGTGLVIIEAGGTGAFLVRRREPPTANSPPPSALKMTPKSSFALLTGWIAALTAPPTVAATPGASSRQEDTVTLSPFTVQADRDIGFSVDRDNSGTRLVTDMRDVGAPVTVFPNDLMDAVNGTSVADVLNFAPNFDTSTESPTGAMSRANFRVRGAGVTSIGLSQDFFRVFDDGDRYKIDRVGFSRGPNSILFGVGDPRGVVTLTPKRASLNENRYSLETQVDNWGSTRLVADASQVLVPRRWGVRAAGVQQSREGAIAPQYRRDRRLFLTSSAMLYTRPRFETQLRANYEWIDGEDVFGNRVLPVDRFSAWQAAGSPTAASRVGTPGFSLPAGTQNYSAANALVHVEGTPGVGVQNWRNTLVGSLAGPERYVFDDAVYPYDVNIKGDSTPAPRHHRNGMVFLEQQLGRDLFVELAAAESTERRFEINRVGASIYVDPNQSLPDGRPNPNVGKWYTQYNGAVGRRDGESESWRASASYKLDFNSFSEVAGRWLGRHNVLGMYEESDRTDDNSNWATVNTTPLPGFPAALNNVQNQIPHRSYLDIRDGVGYFQAIDPFETRNLGNGVNMALLPVGNQSSARIRLQSIVFALQSWFWRDRIVTTLGWRRDDAQSYVAAVPPRDSQGLLPPATTLRNYVKNAEDSFQPVTKGIVFHATPWVSLMYNESENFAGASAALYDLRRRILPPEGGIGRDYGVRFSLLRNSLVVGLSKYESSSTNARTVAINRQLENINNIWVALGRRENEIEGFTARDVQDTQSEGYELTATYNPTKNWRIYAAVTKNLTTTANSYPFLKAYLAEYGPVWTQSSNVIGPAGQTVGQLMALVQSDVANSLAQDGLPGVSMREWNGSLVADYRFTDGLLRGVNVGLTYVYRGEMIAGVPIAAGVPDRDRPYMEPAYDQLGFNVGYRRRVDRFEFRTQLGLQNVNWGTAGRLLIAQRGASGEPLRPYWRQGLTAVWTNTFSF